MRKLEAIFCCLCVAVALGNIVHAKQDVNDSNETLRIDISREVTLYVANDEASVTLKMSLLNGDELARQTSGRLKFKNGILQRIGMAIMMAPLLMQLLWLPGTIASLKLSFLRSILVGKLALAVMLYNTLKSSQKTEMVLIHQPEYHEHYYHTYHQPEDDDEAESNGTSGGLTNNEMSGVTYLEPAVTAFRSRFGGDRLRAGFPFSLPLNPTSKSKSGCDAHWFQRRRKRRPRRHRPRVVTFEIMALDR